MTLASVEDENLARVLASQYDEIVVDELYPGNTILLSVLPSLIEKAEQIL
jgi:hypothetical protein